MKKIDYVTAIGKNRNQIIQTAQTSPIAGRETEMIVNSAGGYSFKTPDEVMLNRFLILGVSGGTYYETQTDLINQNSANIERMLANDPMKVVEVALNVLTNNLALKDNATLFVLAMASSIDDNEVKNFALHNTIKNIRTPYSLFTFINYLNNLRGWGRSVKRAISSWYEDSRLERLGMHSWKYKSREGWSHRDVLRLSHPKTDDPVRNSIFSYMINGKLPENHDSSNHVLQQIAAAEELLHTTDVKKAVQLIKDYRLTREVVPTALLNDKSVWEALITDMPLTALVRNMNKISNVGLTGHFSNTTKYINEMLTNVDKIKLSRIHPMQLFLSMQQYAMGRGRLGSLTWTPDQNIISAMEDAFTLSFGNVEKTGKRIIVAGDDSGSMRWAISEYNNLSVAKLAAAFMFITLKTEDNVVPVTFSTYIKEIKFNNKSTIDHLLAQFGNGGGTNTSLPMEFINSNKLDVDAVVSYTDNATWAGYNHPSEALKGVEKRLGHTVKYINCAMTATNATDVDPNYRSMYQLCGLSANTPRVISTIINE